MTNINILIIEDEKKIADSLREGLTENGFEVIVAYDRTMGLRLFRNNLSRLVLLNIMRLSKFVSSPCF